MSFKILSQQTQVGNKVTSIASIDAFITISYQDIMHLTWRVRSLLEYLFVMSGFYYKQKETSPYIPLKIRTFEWLLLKIAQQTNMFKVDHKKYARTVSANVVRVSFDYLGTCFYICDGVCFQFNWQCQSLFLISSCDEVSFSKVSITINGSNGVCNRACFNCHVFVTWL